MIEEDVDLLPHNAKYNGSCSQLEMIRNYVPRQLSEHIKRSHLQKMSKCETSKGFPKSN